MALQELWPNVPHQVCRFHGLRDASKTAFEADKALKTAMRKRLQPKVREARKQIKKYLGSPSPQEAQQLSVLDEDTNGIIIALNTEGLQPFKYATVEVSLRHLSEKGAGKPGMCAEAGTPAGHCGGAQGLAEQLAQVKHLHGWLLEVGHLLDRSPRAEGEVVSSATIGTHLDGWRERMSRQLTEGSLSELERECLGECLQVPRDVQRDYVAEQ